MKIISLILFTFSLLQFSLSNGNYSEEEVVVKWNDFNGKISYNNLINTIGSPDYNSIDKEGNGSLMYKASRGYTNFDLTSKQIGYFPYFRFHFSDNRLIARRNPFGVTTRVEEIDSCFNPSNNELKIILHDNSLSIYGNSSKPLFISWIPVYEFYFTGYEIEIIINPHFLTDVAMEPFNNESGLILEANNISFNYTNSHKIRVLSLNPCLTINSDILGVVSDKFFVRVRGHSRNLLFNWSDFLMIEKKTSN